jgi:hypothetical protein
MTEQGMNTSDGSASILSALGQGLPMLLLQFVLVLVLLIVGIAIYMAVTPFRERELLRRATPLPRPFSAALLSRWRYRCRAAAAPDFWTAG